MRQREQLEAFNKLYAPGQYQQAAESQVALKSSAKADPADLLTSLQAGTAFRYAQQLAQSNEQFDQAEAILKYHNQQMLLGKTASSVGSILVNDAVLDYSGTAYDGIMINTYKALNFWQQGDQQNARVEFNRALDRQRRAKEYFAQEIAKNRQAVAKKQAQDGVNYQKNLDNPQIDRIIQKSYSNLDNFAAYPDFINPFTTYLAGLFFLHDGSYNKAADLLKEAYGMMPKQAVIKDDFIHAQKLATGAHITRKHTWVIFENGMGPMKQEFRVDLPIFIFTRNLSYTGIALPKLTMQALAYPHVNVMLSPDKVYQTKTFASMDRVIQTEFKKQYPWIVSRALLSAIVKTTAQYYAQQGLGTWGGIAAGLMQLATTAADLRIWSALPKEFQIAKVTTPKDGKLKIETPNQQSIVLELDPQKNHLLYLKIPMANAPIAYDLLTL
ncbi:MAG: hypothetical protein methR_P2067 [Methyloprofundus sp.]|nr:MAG: hypothetical protein methR_P2067 [Methyloprofundus sp.]